MYEFCGSGGSLTPVYIPGGLSFCFSATIFPALGLTCLLLNTIRLFSSSKPKTSTFSTSNPGSINDDQLIQLVRISNWWRNTQLFLNACAIFVVLMDLIIRVTVHYGLQSNNNDNFGSFVLFSLSLDLIAWGLLCLIVSKDHNDNVVNSFFSFAFWIIQSIYAVIVLASVKTGLGAGTKNLVGLIELIKMVIILLLSVLSIFISIKIGLERKALNKLVAEMEGTKKEKPSFFSRVLFLFPYVWPQESVKLQIRVLLCVGLLILGRIVNLYVPIIYKSIIDELSSERGSTSYIRFPADLIGIYIALQFLQGGTGGGSGLINNMRSFLWIRITQYTSKKMKIKLFAHLHSLSLHWHLGRKTGEVLRIMDRGTDSVNNLLNSVVFSILPNIVDIMIAVVYFIIKFDALFGILVMATMTSYLVWTIVVTEWRTKYRKAMNQKDNEARSMSVDSLLNFETVKYFAAEKFETSRFQKFIDGYQNEEFHSQSSLNFLNTGQSIVIGTGLCLGTMLCGYQVSNEGGNKLQVSDYVLFIAYIQQLYAPLNFFGTYWRMIQQYYTDMENMFELLDIEPYIDLPGSKPMEIRKGAAIEFKKVCFGYSESKLILNNLSFYVPAGQTFAIVGPSGAGKSSLLRLMFRLYDLHSGSIEVDGQDIAHCTQESVRQKIGVVPQDCVLFNDSIFYNIKYGNVGANDETIFQAAEAAEIHNGILSFEKGYDTVVGERGLRLSGGEKQRVAIARTILKDPAIVLLDEATSALDTETERRIQASLNRICQNRTALVVAHRLSTIIGADQILVLNEGHIVERGSHHDLLEKGGLYSEMWQKQLQINEERADDTEKTK